MRGYNQAGLLARAIGRQQRYRQMQHVFSTREQIPAKEGILLLDDIYTTGTTADAVAGALILAGSRRIYVGTIAIGG